MNLSRRVGRSLDRQGQKSPTMTWKITSLLKMSYVPRRTSGKSKNPVLPLDMTTHVQPQRKEKGPCFDQCSHLVDSSIRSTQEARHLTPWYARRGPSASQTNSVPPHFLSLACSNPSSPRPAS